MIVPLKQYYIAGTVYKSCNSFVISEKRVEVVFNERIASLISCKE